MSADNWAICPRCVVLHETAVSELSEKVDQSYGSVSLEEFDRLRDNRDHLAATPPKSTLREDYEIGTYEDGEFFISYTGRCTACDFEKNFEHREAVS